MFDPSLSTSPLRKKRRSSGTFDQPFIPLPPDRSMYRKNPHQSFFTSTCTPTLQHSLGHHHATEEEFLSSSGPQNSSLITHSTQMYSISPEKLHAHVLFTREKAGEDDKVRRGVRRYRSGKESLTGKGEEGALIEVDQGSEDLEAWRRVLLSVEASRDRRNSHLSPTAAKQELNDKMYHPGRRSGMDEMDMMDPELGGRMQMPLEMLIHRADMMLVQRGLSLEKKRSRFADRMRENGMSETLDNKRKKYGSITWTQRLSSPEETMLNRTSSSLRRSGLSAALAAEGKNCEVNPIPMPRKIVMYKLVDELRETDPPIPKAMHERANKIFTWHENLALLLTAVLQESEKNPFKSMLDNFNKVLNSASERPQRDRSSLRKRLQKLLHAEKLTANWPVARRAAANLFVNTIRDLGNEAAPEVQAGLFQAKAWIEEVYPDLEPDVAPVKNKNPALDL